MTIGTTIGTPGLGWRTLEGRRPMTIGAVGDLLSYPEVMTFQRIYNSVRISSLVLPAAQQIPGGAIDEDGVYASETQTALERYINYLVRRSHPGCGSDSSVQARTNGPNGVASCLAATGMSRAILDRMQQAWNEWKARPAADPRGRDPVDPYADARAACTTSGGTWDAAANVCIPAGAPDEGMGTGTWILLLLLGAAVAGGIYYVATE